MKKMTLALVCVLAAIGCEATISHLYSSFGVRPDGLWTNGNCNLRMSADSFFESGYVYTNALGIVHQFSLQHRFPKSTDEASALDQLKKHEQRLAKIFMLTPFTTHVDSNPNRYLWSEECSMVGCGDWSVRLYLERDGKPDGLVAKASYWSPMLASTKPKIVIQLDERGASDPLTVDCDGDRLAVPELEKRLSAVARKDKKTPILLRVSAKSPQGDLVSVLDVCNKHGLFSVSIFTK